MLVSLLHIPFLKHPVLLWLLCFLLIDRLEFLGETIIFLASFFLAEPYQGLLLFALNVFGWFPNFLANPIILLNLLPMSSFLWLIRLLSFLNVQFLDYWFGFLFQPI